MTLDTINGRPVEYLRTLTSGMFLDGRWVNVEYSVFAPTDRNPHEANFFVPTNSAYIGKPGTAFVALDPL